MVHLLVLHFINIQKMLRIVEYRRKYNWTNRAEQPIENTTLLLYYQVRGVVLWGCRQIKGDKEERKKRDLGG